MNSILQLLNSIGRGLIAELSDLLHFDPLHNIFFAIKIYPPNQNEQYGFSKCRKSRMNNGKKSRRLIILYLAWPLPLTYLLYIM